MAEDEDQRRQRLRANAGKLLEEARAVEGPEANLSLGSATEAERTLLVDGASLAAGHMRARSITQGGSEKVVSTTAPDATLNLGVHPAVVAEATVAATIAGGHDEVIMAALAENSQESPLVAAFRQAHGDWLQSEETDLSKEPDHFANYVAGNVLGVASETNDPLRLVVERQVQSGLNLLQGQHSDAHVLREDGYYQELHRRTLDLLNGFVSAAEGQKLSGAAIPTPKSPASRRERRPRRVNKDPLARRFLS